MYGNIDIKAIGSHIRQRAVYVSMRAHGQYEPRLISRHGLGMGRTEDEHLPGREGGLGLHGPAVLDAAAHRGEGCTSHCSGWYFLVYWMRVIRLGGGFKVGLYHERLDWTPGLRKLPSDGDIYWLSGLGEGCRSVLSVVNGARFV